MDGINLDELAALAPNECPRCGFPVVYTHISGAILTPTRYRTPDIRTVCALCDYDYTTAGCDTL